MCGRCWRGCGTRSASPRILSSPSARVATGTKSPASAGPRRFRAPTSREVSDVTQRVAFVLRVRPDRIDEYVEAHRNVWPEMLDALRNAGIRNYSIFRDGTRVFGYFETDDLEATEQYMAAQ